MDRPDIPWEVSRKTKKMHDPDIGKGIRNLLFGVVMISAPYF